MTAALKRRVAREFERYESGRVVHPEFDDVSLFVELALDWTATDFEDSAALLLFLVQAPAARDVILLHWATDLSMGDRLWQVANRPWGEDPQWDEIVGNLRVGVGPRPDAVRLERGIAVVQGVVAVAPAEYKPPLVFMLAWLNWALGSWGQA